MNLVLGAGVFLLAGCFLRAQAPPAQDWRKVTALPALDTSGLSVAQKAELMKILREEGCTCNCGMRVAECRVKDPGCGDSRALASVAVQQLKAGKSSAQIRAALRDSELARARRANLFGEPVKLSLDGAPSRGPANARITIVEFSDFQCPYCRTAAKNVYTLLGMFPKDARLVYKQFPLDEHSQAAIAAEGALAAHAQGKFWEMHDKMFAAPREISRAKLSVWARELGLDLAKFNGELDSGKYKAQVRKDVREGVSAGVQGTPTFFINGRQYRGAMDPAQLKPILEEELKKTLQAQAR